ncbi:spore germination lipoprotein GerD [Paenibacillus sp. J2TS4]|uniref:spore germination lipoprotein GerD n=1 Tax=Paenibacillus sp. J2TS4 TaxID=2807194 RepID=UPI001B25DA52|nr:spore germination lipoprotein GerD [Paenibacillus sp. J2TS4]GIP36301.1 germination protein GerD [Paenibacillus sp. J2TS4]
MIHPRLRILPALICIVLLLTSCGTGKQQSSQNQQSYKDIKSMMLDILNSEDGQKAVQEASKKNQDPTMKLLSTGEGQQIQIAVKEVLTDPNHSQLIEKTMTDPKFAGDFAKSVQKYNKQLTKDLMKDPEYQQQMLDLMRNPEFEKIILETMKNSQYRQQTMKIIEESMQSPLFRDQLMELFKKAIEEEMKPQGKEGKGKQQGKEKEGGKQEGKEGGKSSEGGDQG